VATVDDRTQTLERVIHVSYTGTVFDDVDWKYRGDYMTERHGVSTEAANEALADTDAVVFDPDPKSRSGVSLRVIGYSWSLRRIITVILVPNEDGGYWGANGWPSSTTERRIYNDQEGVDDDG